VICKEKKKEKIQRKIKKPVRKKSTLNRDTETHLLNRSINDVIVKHVNGYLENILDSMFCITWDECTLN
jgi:uncharacterized protein YwgA